MREVTIGRRDDGFVGAAFIEDQSAASCEDGSEVSHRRELSAVDLPVRSVWADHVSCDVDSTGR